MSVGNWSAVLVLGGAGSGRLGFAESLVAEATTVVRPDQATDAERLVARVTEAKPDEVLLVDDVTAWVDALPAEGRGEAVAGLAAAVRAGPGRVVFVGPAESDSDDVASTTRALAAACDSVALVVAGQAVWVKSVSGVRVTAPPPAAPRPARPRSSRGMIQPGMSLPLPDEQAGSAARSRLATLDLPGSGLGSLAETVVFAAATQGSATPEPWASALVLLLHGDHGGGALAGDSTEESARRAHRTRTGDSPLALLATEAGAGLHVVEAPAAYAIEYGDALSLDEVDEALEQGWQLAEDAADSGADVIVLGACGAGVDTAAAAIVAITTATEAVKLLGRVVSASGRVDDDAWMVRAAALRDALHRVRHRQRSARELLSGLGGGDMAVATGVLLGAASRRTPVMVDGPLGLAAGLVSRELGGQARHWMVLPDLGGNPAVKQAADVLGLAPVLNLHLGLGEGTTALAALPLLRLALTLAQTPPST